MITFVIEKRTTINHWKKAFTHFLGLSSTIATDETGSIKDWEKSFRKNKQTKQQTHASTPSFAKSKFKFKYFIHSFREINISLF